MTIVEFVQQSKTGRELHFMKEVRVISHFHQLHQSVRKNAIVMFMSELLSRTIQEEETNKPLFDFFIQLIALARFETRQFCSFSAICNG